jgi:hypothetical protein
MAVMRCFAHDYTTFTVIGAVWISLAIQRCILEIIALSLMEKIGVKLFSMVKMVKLIIIMIVIEILLFKVVFYMKTSTMIISSIFTFKNQVRSLTLDMVLLITLFATAMRLLR